MANGSGRRGRLAARDGRVVPWFQVSVGETARLAEVFTGRRLPIARSIYFALLELANEQRAASVDATRGELADRAGVNVRVLDEYANELVAAGLLRVDRRGDRGLPNEWVLTYSGDARSIAPPVQAADTGGCTQDRPPIETGQEGKTSSSATARDGDPLVEGVELASLDAAVPDEMRADAGELLRGKTRVDGRQVTGREMTIAAAALAEFNRQAGSDYGLGANLTAVVMRVRERPSYDAAAHVRLVRSAFRCKWWERQGRRGRRLSPQVIYGNERVFEQVVQDAIDERNGGGRTPERRFVRRARDDSSNDAA